MTGKERALLRAKANGLDTILQIGKAGITDALLAQIDGALNTRELIKISALETAPDSIRAFADQLSAATGAEVIQVIGSRAVLYRYSEPLHEKERIKKQNIKAAEKYRRNKVREKVLTEKKEKAKINAIRRARQENALVGGDGKKPASRTGTPRTGTTRSGASHTGANRFGAQRTGASHSGHPGGGRSYSSSGTRKPRG